MYATAGYFSYLHNTCEWVNKKMPEVTYAKLYFANLRYSGMTNEQNIIKYGFVKFLNLIRLE